MGRSTKTSWLEGPGDLKEADVEDVPVPGESVRVRGLAAAYSNEAQNAATELKVVGENQIISVSKAKLEAIQFSRGVIDPVFSVEEAEQIASKYGPAFRKVVDKIDELSAIDKEAIEEATARFPSSGDGSPNGGEARVHEAPDGDGEPAVPARAGAGVEDASGGDV